jgi:hypothetical protein
MGVSARGPAWLGIGAQRSGTTWFTDLLLQHPRVTLSRQQRKELHGLYSSLMDGWGEQEKESYRAMFDVGGLSGECTPYYLRACWMAPLARDILPPEAPVIVLLRDPVERFASAMRHKLTRSELAHEERGRLPELRNLYSDAQWGGMYASQLEAWAAAVGRERMMVFQYEAVRADPVSAVESVWSRLGLNPVPLVEVDRPSRVSTASDVWQLPASMAEQLCVLYRGEVERLTQNWGIDPGLWRQAGEGRG